MMGVRKNLKLLPSDGAGEGLAEELIEDPNILAKPAHSSPARSKRTKKYTLFMRDVRKKPKGARQLRRNENMNNLLQSEQDTMSLLDEEDYMNICEPSLSAFATLFLEQEKMRAWNDFVNHTEEDQQEILSGMKSLSLDESEAEETDDNDWFSVTSCPNEALADEKRQIHPAFSADECFMRIDQKLRLFLRKQHLPVGMLRGFEEDMMEFFSEWPTSVYVAHTSSSFERMLIHALSQYLNLISRSYDVEDGERKTQVENKCTEFHPPLTALSDYLHKKHTKD